VTELEKFNFEAPELISIGAQSIADRAVPLGISWVLSQATVINGKTPSSVLAILDGDNVAIAMTSMVGPLPTAARVYVMRVPPGGNFITGFITNGPLALNMECNRDFGLTVGTTTSATLTDMPGPPTLNFTKISDLSGFRVDLAGTFFSSGADAGIEAGVSIGSLGSFPIAALTAANGSNGIRNDYTGFDIIRPANVSGGLFPAGPYVITGQWRRNNGAGTLNVGNDDVWNLCVTEVP